MSEFRYDAGSLKPATKMPNGWLRVDGYLTRSGVFEYLNSDGSKRRELRPDDEVFKTDSLSSFGMVPVTDDHPSEVLNSTNTSKFQRGTVGESVRRDGDAVRASMLITDAALAEKMQGGKLGLSCGYEVDLDHTAGVHPVHGRYDAVQRNIRGNHVAVVSAGRAGPMACARMDAAVQVEDAAWSAAEVNDLPDSAFLHVESGGEKDADGKTTPRSLRHFPYRGSDGAIDLPHLRNALARIPQSDLPDAVKNRAAGHAEELLKKEKSESGEGASDADNRGDGGGVYPIHVSTRPQYKGDAEARADMIKKEGDKYCVYSADGSKKLGEYDTKAEAEKRLAQIEYFKKDAVTEHAAIAAEAEIESRARYVLNRGR